MRLLTSSAQPGPEKGGPTGTAGGSRPAASGSPRSPEDDIPEVPPLSLRDPYLRFSRSYLRWCLGMLLWCILCVGYFVLTEQWLYVLTAFCLCLLLLANVIFPATFFGGSTWYKRLGWGTILTVLFAAMFAWPLYMIFRGVGQRMAEGRYRGIPYLSDIWHLLLCVLTVVLGVWTVRLAVRGGRIIRKLQTGDYRA